MNDACQETTFQQISTYYDHKKGIALQKCRAIPFLYLSFLLLFFKYWRKAQAVIFKLRFFNISWRYH